MEESRNNNVKVCVRIRPLSATEQRSRRCIKVIKGGEAVYIGDKEFLFDGIYTEDATQASVYSGSVANLVEGAFEGYNATLFAYGQTGSGKTYSVIGVPQGEEDEGIIPRVIREMFNKVEECESKKYVTKLNVRFVEIYNEDFIDLLHPEVASKDIVIREDKQGNICFLGAKEEPIYKIKDAIYYLERGLASRTTAETLMNLASSRSHAIFTISVAIYVPDDNVPNQGGVSGGKSGSFLYSKLHIVDLAGSERAKRTGSEGLRLKESAGINQGLMTLGKVIRALTESSKSISIHIPYRESKLTRFLQDSLGGNSRTAMLACVSPSELNLQETLSTLQYAARTRNIRNKVVANVAVASIGGGSNNDESSQVINDLQTQIAKMQAEMQQMMMEKTSLLQQDRAEQFKVPRYIGQLDEAATGRESGLVIAAISEISLSNLIRSTNQLRNSSNTRETKENVESLLSSLDIFLGTNKSFGAFNSAESSISSSSHGDLPKIFHKLGLDVQLKDLKSSVNSDAIFAKSDKVIDMLRKELSECKEDLVRDEEIFAEKVRELKKNRTLIKQLQQDNSGYQSKVEELSAQLLQALSSNSHASVLNSNLGEDDLELSIAVAASEPDISQLMDDLETISKEKELIVQEKNAAEEKYQQTIQATQLQKFEYEEQKRMMVLNLQKLEDSIYNKEILIKDLTINQSKSQAAIKHLEDTVSQLNDSLRDLDSERARSNKEIDEAREQRTVYEEKLSKAQSQLKLLRLNFQSQAKASGGGGGGVGDSKADSKGDTRERGEYASSIPVLVAERKESSSPSTQFRSSASLASAGGIADSKGAGDRNYNNNSSYSGSRNNIPRGSEAGESKAMQQQDDLVQLNRQYALLKEQYIRDEVEYGKRLQGLISQVDLHRSETLKSQKQIESLEKKNNALKVKVLQITNSNQSNQGNAGGMDLSLSLSMSLDQGTLKSMLQKISSGTPSSPSGRDRDKSGSLTSASAVKLRDNVVVESISSLLNKKLEDIVALKRTMKELCTKSSRVKVCEGEKQEILHEIENILQSIRDKEVSVKKQLKETKSKLKPLIQELQSIKDRSQGDLSQSGLKQKAADLFHEIKVYQDHYEELQGRQAEYQSAGQYHPTVLELKEELETLETEIELNHKSIREEVTYIQDMYFSKSSPSISREQMSALYSDDNSIDLFIHEKINVLVNDILIAINKKSSLNSISPLNTNGGGGGEDSTSFQVQVEKSDNASLLVAYSSIVSFFRLMEKWEADKKDTIALRNKITALQTEGDETKDAANRLKTEMTSRLEQLHFEHQDKVNFLLQQLKEAEQLRSIGRPSSSGGLSSRPQVNSNSNNNSSNISNNVSRALYSSPAKLDPNALSELRVTERGLELGNALVPIHSPSLTYIASRDRGPGSIGKGKTNVMSLSIEADASEPSEPVLGAIHQEVLRRLQTEKDRRELLERRNSELVKELRLSKSQLSLIATTGPRK